MVKTDNKRKFPFENSSTSTKRTKKESNAMIQKINERFSRKTILSDGNCLYRAIMYCIKQDDTLHLDLRKQIYQFIKANEEYCVSIFQEIEGGKSFKSHIETILKESYWGGLFELKIAAKLLNFNFIVYRPNSFDEFATYSFKTNTQTIYLEWENFNHFNSLIPNLIKIQLPKKLTNNTVENIVTQFNSQKDQESKHNKNIGSDKTLANFKFSFIS